MAVILFRTRSIPRVRPRPPAPDALMRNYFKSALSLWIAPALWWLDFLTDLEADAAERAIRDRDEDRD